MYGVINVLKPPGMTSFDVISFLRRVTKIKKIGHMGTLDPEAVGVLPICIGKATKVIEFLMEKDKVYVAEATFGFTTNTEDWTGEVTEEKGMTHCVEDVENVVKSFIGKYQQVPPMYSAIKINGDRLYKLARNGEEIERPSREVQIYSLAIKKLEREKVLFEVNCSKGTYIRTLCKDIGEKLGCGGHMSFLARIKAGEFVIDNALTLEEIESLAKEGKLEDNLTSVENLFDHLQSMTFNDSDLREILNGIAKKLPKKAQENAQENELVKLYNQQSQWIGIGEIIKKGESFFIKRRKIFFEE